MKNPNYKIYADVGMIPIKIISRLSVLDAGAGLNLIHNRLIPREAFVSMRNSGLTDVGDVNERPLISIGVLNLVFCLGNCMVKVNFIAVIPRALQLYWYAIFRIGL